MTNGKSPSRQLHDARRRSVASIVNSEHISHLVLVFLSLTLNMQLLTGVEPYFQSGSLSEILTIKIDLPGTSFNCAENLSSGFVEWSCAEVINTAPMKQNFKNYHRENCFTQFSTKICWNKSFPTSDLFRMSNIKEYRCLKNVIHQIAKNEWLLLSAFKQGAR